MKLANERREKPRVNVKGTAFVFDQGGRQQVTLRNLSAVGMLVEIPRAPKPKTDVRVGLCLDGKSWLELHGVVRRVAKRKGSSECAIDLRPSDERLRGVIEKYVQHVAQALTVAKQREMFKARFAGMSAADSGTRSRDELIKSVLPGAVMPPDTAARTPAAGVSAVEVLAARQAAARMKSKAKPKQAEAPVQPPKRSTRPPDRPKQDPKVRALFKAAMEDVDGK